MGKIIGIDLGTTNSCVAVFEGNEPVVIANSEGKRTTPSVVGFVEGGERKIGDPAKRQAITNPKNTVYSIKRFMGETYEQTAKEVSRVPFTVVNEGGYPRVDIDGRRYTPQEISAMVLQKMKKTAEDYLGQEVTDNTQREIAQALSGLEPAVSIDIQYVDVPDRLGCQVIAMYFEAFVWGTAPYTYHGSPYYKVESTTKLMPRNMFEERLRANKPNYYAWERQSADDITIDDMDEKLIRGAIRLGVEKNRMPATALTEPLSDVLRKLELMNDGVPNNAAAALFSTKLKGYTQMQLRLARFRGINKIEFIDNQRVEGNFFQLLDAGMAFFLKHLNMSGKIVVFRRE